MPMSDYDRDNVEEILNNSRADWFTAKLFKLIAVADRQNRYKLYKSFPDEVSVVHKYQTGNQYSETDIGKAHEEVYNGEINERS